MNQPITRKGCGSSGRPAFDTDGVYLIRGDDLNRIIRVQLRLYSERRMDANEMRDEAHALGASLDATCSAPGTPRW